ncbi:MAG: hypothetical protein AAGJ87_16435, partial [Pseudomonadota bacterium]
MKPTVGLLLVQSALLIFLSARVIAIDARSANTAANVNAMNIRLADGSVNNATPPSRPVDEAAIAAAVKAAIREELDALGDRAVAPVESASASAVDVIRSDETPPPYDPQAVEDVVAVLRNDLGLYIGKGEISETEMAEYQRKLARLPPTE